MQTSHRFSVALARPWLIGAAALAALVAGIVLLHPRASNADPASTTVVSTAKTGLGRVLVNSRGHTLYLFGKDRNGKSACSGQCASFWPPLIANGKPQVAGGAKASLIGTIKRADGRRQVTYNHHPLYTFVKDTKKGQVRGEGLSAFGSKWYAVSPAGAKVVPHPGNGIPQNNRGAARGHREAQTHRESQGHREDCQARESQAAELHRITGIAGPLGSERPSPMSLLRWCPGMNRHAHASRRPLLYHWS